MDQREYEEKYNKIKSGLREFGEKKQVCLALKRVLEIEEEDREREIKVAYTRNEEIEEDWRNRNMIGNKGYLFRENEAILRKINFARNDLLQNNFEDLSQYTKELSLKEEEYRERLLKLTQEYENQKEEEDGAYY